MHSRARQSCAHKPKPADNSVNKDGGGPTFSDRTCKRVHASRLRSWLAARAMGQVVALRGMAALKLPSARHRGHSEPVFQCFQVFNMCDKFVSKHSRVERQLKSVEPYYCESNWAGCTSRARDTTGQVSSISCPSFPWAKAVLQRVNRRGLFTRGSLQCFAEVRA